MEQNEKNKLPLELEQLIKVKAEETNIDFEELYQFYVDIAECLSKIFCSALEITEFRQVLSSFFLNQK